MPNAFVEPALVLWIPITFVLFARLRPTTAAAISLLGASLLLPVGWGFDFPGLPSMDRDRIAAASALIACAVYAPRAFRRSRPGRGVEWILVLMVLGGFGTALTNTDPVAFVGKGTRPGLSYWEGMSQAASTVLDFWIPFYLGRVLFRSPRDLRRLLFVWAAAGVIYGFLALWEVRMSPRLHYDLYGYVPAQWRQQIRDGGWRPMVFAGHGLALSLYLVTAAMACVGLGKDRVRIQGIGFGWGGAFLYGVVSLCNSLAALIYASVLLPLQAWSPARIQRLAIRALAVVVLTYPMLRAFDLFPTTQLVDLAGKVNPYRAASLEFRFTNEDILAERAFERPLFGWGRFGRNLVYDERKGRQDVRTDGFWINQFSEAGAVGFACSFGIMLAPVWIAVRATTRRRLGRDQYLLLAAAWIVTVSAVDLIPNGFLASRTLLVSGAMVGTAEGHRRAMRAARRRPRESGAEPPAAPAPEPPPRLGDLLAARRAGPPASDPRRVAVGRPRRPTGERR